MNKRTFKISTSKLLEQKDMEKLFVFQRKGTDLFLARVNNHHFEFKQGLNGAYLFNSRNMGRAKFLLAFGKSELLTVSEVLNTNP